jgi:hypothetical protein
MTMTHLLRTDIEIGDLSLEVDLEYDFIPGEKMVRYDKDGSGYPGSPTSAEFVSAMVSSCEVDGKQQKRDGHWAWNALDIVVAELIDRDWDRCFREKCIEHFNDKSERDDER